MQINFQPHGPASEAGAPPKKPRDRVHVVADGFVYAGTWTQVSSQRNSALLYLAASPSDVEIEVAGSTARVAAALVPPRVLKHLRARGEPFVCFDVCPTHPAYFVFSKLPSSDLRVLPREHFAELSGALCAFHSGAMSSRDSVALYHWAVDRAAALMPPVPPMDPRVREVMRLLREQRAHSLQTLADAVSISKDWLSHLFLRETGISIRKYEQTLKLQAAAAFLGRPNSLTEIAAAAGFADSAHFSKVWKRHYGFAPNHYFDQRGSVAVDPIPWPPCIAMPLGPEPLSL